MKEINCFFNIDKLGGAEKSMLNTLSTLQNNFQVKIILPQFGAPSELVNYLKNNQKYESLNTPREFYQLSSKNLFTYLANIKNLITFLKNIRTNLDSDIVWINGTRIGVFVLLSKLFISKKNTTIWHCRDYPRKNRILRTYLKFCFKILDVKLVCNSKDVEISYQNIFPNQKTFLLYNSIDKLLPITTSGRPQTLGVVGMLVPWKGQNQVLVMANLYEKELRSLGIEKVEVYGDQIYQTKNDAYKNELGKFANDFIEFKGHQVEDDIYKNIDILIHSSVAPEPFGRVIIEAFNHSIPVITTALGGALEVAQDSALTFEKYHYFELFKCIEKICQDQKTREDLINKGHQKLQSIEAEIESQTDNIITHLN